MRSFPDDLVQAQQEWSATYHRLAGGPGRTELRRRLYRLSTEVLFHPYWREGGRTPAAWAELRKQGRGGRSWR
ncbi:hypothetical protein IM697_01655 [Streptomyces ferrugineus]|uniref:Uncharacterized protein n=1 Tax=Streptomyces ferrugineus TaxID=1413221 RepID=A0A7M2SP00_9ACTN|nr:hypothetical protein [Streptomyces ferrugineus]QOV37198.1 hypothetical protein IM697_01655 [Streptomyces ferrugineus]